MRLENELLGVGAAKFRRNGTRAAGEGDPSYKNGNVWFRYPLPSVEGAGIDRIVIV
jgi:hypothetical protein